MKKQLIIIAFFVLGMALWSCEKEKEEDEPQKEVVLTNTQSIEDNNRQQREFDDVMNLAFVAINEELGASNTKTSSSLCASVTVGESSNQLVIDFGEDGCAYNGVTRKGKVIFYYKGHYEDSGSVIKISLDNYRVQNTFLSQEFVKVEGIETITNKGLVSGKMRWVVDVKGAKITFENGEVSTWESNQIRILYDEGTTNPLDEIYHIYGNASGVNRKGGAYTASSISADPVVFDYPCWLSKRMLVGGTITVKPEGELIRTIDYGYEKVPGEACDRAVKVTYGTFSFNLDL